MLRTRPRHSAVVLAAVVVIGGTYDFGGTARAYVVAFDGRFTCNPPACDVPSMRIDGVTQSRTSTSEPSRVPVSTIVLSFDPKTLQEGGGLRVVDHEVDMSKLGRVHSLDGHR